MKLRVIFAILAIFLLVGVSQAGTYLLRVDTSGSGDGSIWRESTANDLAQIFGSVAGATNSDPTGDYQYVRLYAYTSAGVYQEGGQFEMFFDTSALPDSGITIDNATLVVFINGGGETLYGLGHVGYGIAGTAAGTPGTINVNDFQRAATNDVLYSNIIADTALADYGNSTFTLNAAALANISKTGYTGYRMRMTPDINNSATGLTWSSGAVTGTMVRTSEGSHKPEILIGYHDTAVVTPVASFTKNVSSGYSPLSVGFTDSSTNSPTAWNWSFTNVTPGNNTQVWFSQVQNPAKAFGAGNFSIKLNASNSAGYNITPGLSWVNVSSASSAPAPLNLHGLQIYPADNVWNTKIDTLPVDANSAQYVIGGGAADPNAYLYVFTEWPIMVVNNSQAYRNSLYFDYDSNSDHVGYQFPNNTVRQEGTSDHHAIAINAQNLTLFESYHFYQYPNQSFTMGTGAYFDLKSNALTWAPRVTADAAGLPMLPGLIRADEVVDDGVIDHALRFCVYDLRNTYIWPARGAGGSENSSTSLPPHGQRFRLKASYNTVGYNADELVVLTALKEYGMILADYNGDDDSFFQLDAQENATWGIDEMSFSAIRLTDFEAVDESALIVDEDSGQVSGYTPTPTPTTPVPTTTTIPPTTTTPVPTTTTPTPPAPPMDGSGPDDFYTKTLLHFDNSTNSSTTFIDEHGRVWTPSGSAVTLTNQKKFGESSGYFPWSSTSYISAADSTDFAFTTKNGTTDMWVYPTTQPTEGNTRTIWSQVKNGTHRNYLAYGMSSGNYVLVQQHWTTTGQRYETLTSATPILPTNTWSHLATVENTTFETLYLNGVSVGSMAITGTDVDIDTSFYIGTYSGYGASTFPWSGYIDEFRISDTARWESTFIPPTHEYRSAWNYTTAGTYYWTCPPYVTQITLQLAGGGGSGAPGGSEAARGTGGNASVATRISRLTVVPGTVYTLIIGGGGAQAPLGSYSNAGASTIAFGNTALGGRGGTTLASYGSGTKGENSTWNTLVKLAQDGGLMGSTYVGGVGGYGSGAGGGGGAADAAYPIDGRGGAGAAGYVSITDFSATSGNIPDFVGSPLTGPGGTLVHFTDTSIVRDSSGITYNWSFGDGSYSDTLGDTQHVFSWVGSYDVSLTITTTNDSVQERKNGYINLVTPSGSTVYPASRSVSIKSVDTDSHPLSNVMISATPLNFTAPEGWVESYYGIAGVEISGTTLSGVTGSDGSWSAPLMSAYLYRFEMTRTPDIDYEISIYPSSDSYVITIPLGVVPLPTSAESIVVYSLSNAQINSTHQYFNVTYSDTSAQGTDVLKFYVRNFTGGLVASANYTGATSNAQTFSRVVAVSQGQSYTYGFAANQTEYGWINQTDVVTLANQVALIGAAPGWVEEWIAIGLIILFAALFSIYSKTLALIILPLLAWFFQFIMGWLPANFMSTISLGCMLTLGVALYIRQKENMIQ